MATKKAAKSSKTAHVLNVLAGTQDLTASGEEDLAEAGAAGNVAEAPAPSRPLLPPVLEDARASDDALGGKILDALSEALYEVDGAPADIALEQEVSPPPEPVPQLSPDPAPPEPVETPPEPPVNVPLPTKELSGDLIYVNIMQALVEEKAQKYIDMFGLCSCSRCVADVKALALSNLPPKYAVMHRGEIIPMLTVYERRYSSALTAQIVAACKLVMQCPRH